MELPESLSKDRMSLWFVVNALAVFSPFLASGFEASEYVANIISNSSVPASVSKLNTGIGSLDRVLEEQVLHSADELLLTSFKISQHYVDLLEQAKDLKELDAVLGAATQSVKELEASVSQ
jgi:hypothetical protein